MSIFFFTLFASYAGSMRAADVCNLLSQFRSSCLPSEVKCMFASVYAKSSMSYTTLSRFVKIGF